MTGSQIKQWTSGLDGLDKLQLSTAAMPEPKEGEVLVKILSVSLNYRDTEVCMGLYNHHKSVGGQEQLVPCSDACGVIVDAGSSHWKTGQRVMTVFNQTHLSGQVKSKDMASGLGLPLPGVLTEYRCFSAESLVPVPDYLSDDEAATLPIAAVTAWMSINQFRPIDKPADGDVEETVLFQGTGGVAVSGLQIAHAAGLKTIITSSSDDKLERAKKLGADHGINYKTQPDWQDEVNKITNDNGADIILETGGAQTLRKSFDCIAFGGLIDCIGYLSGKEDAPGVNTNVLALRRNVTIKGILNGPRDRFEEMCRFYAKHEIHPVVDKVFEFEQAKEGLQYLYSGGHFGKVVVKVA
ncbi:Putative GroES-like superfamily, alcohol dehydrogenase-like, NAD(P)-binding domain superfamily [Septoria linicola]|uniref:GroES-like superfamily, alcohol dehydrogenase-like, NAD(P)-binding domain superfamily n=1 Tax=Septoria linicola TaxID=215465 RepID=A0A9Q9ALL8_9PEZI|nr:putative GroES-like superfamily, alcohol dehydrogenase-like, NAD(P)-binding domain superfamily [Septoria linicola]USW47066.1 Putative GroES-like superfamily, alcohol dehydrogenase-like, NAD(P)-binding domain superfamily [Septoria linicola]